MPAPLSPAPIPARRARRLPTVCALLLLPFLAASALAAPPQPSPFSFYERYVAIDDACAWPCLQALPNGDLAVLIWPHNVHGKVEGAVENWISRDHGIKWTKAGIPAAHEPGCNRMNVAAGVVDGGLVALIGGFGYHYPPYEEGARFWSKEAIAAIRNDRTVLPPAAVTSTDSGTTWSRHADLDAAIRPSGQGHLIPYGRVAGLPDGSLGVMLYGEGVYFYTSRDRGKSWHPRGVLAKAEPQLPFKAAYNETTWIPLANGDLYAVARSFPKPGAMGGLELDGFRSTDGGVTWVKEQALALPDQVPGDIIRMHDGRLLLSYSSRNAGSRAIWLRFGSPDARNWSAPTLLVDLEGSGEQQYDPAPVDGGYPSTVLAQDGTYVTAYYSRGVPAHQRYHMGVVRWRLRDHPAPVAVK